MEKRRSDTIAEELEELILNGTLADGERLDEARLSERYSVSRTPLREALQRLAQSGLVELIPRRGAFVRQPGPLELMEMFEVMAELEAVCGRLAAKRITERAIEDLHETNEKCQEALEVKDTNWYYLENERFHKIIYRESGNAFLEKEAIRLHNRLKPFRRLQLRLRGRLEQSMQEHKQIVSALSRGQPEEASNALREHVAVQGEKFHYLMAHLKRESQMSA